MSLILGGLPSRLEFSYGPKTSQTNSIVRAENSDQQPIFSEKNLNTGLSCGLVGVAFLVLRYYDFAWLAWANPPNTIEGIS